MLSSSVLTQITPFQAKSLVEIVCDSYGSRFEMHGNEPKLESLPGDFAKLCGVLYRTLQDIPISDIRAVVEEEAASIGERPLDVFSYYDYYFRSTDLIQRVADSQHNKVADIKRLLRNEAYLNKIVADARAKVTELQGGTNIYMLYSRVADTRVSLRKRAGTFRTGNRRYFDHQPDLYEALENDYWEYLRTFPDMYEDDTLNMSKILGANRERVFYNVWFRTKFAKHLQGISTVNYEGEDLPTWQILNTSFKQHIDVDLLDIMNRVISISQDMFNHRSASGTPVDISLQYSIFEYYIEKKLKTVVDHLNSAYTDIIRSHNHKIKVPFKLRSKCKIIFQLNTEFGVGRRLSQSGGIGVDASFRARVKNNKAILSAIDSMKNNLSVETIAEKFAKIERNAYFSTNPGKDSNRPYFEHGSQQRYFPLLYTPDNFTEQMANSMIVDIIPDSVYTKIGDIIRCLCDLENLDAALERYGLSIVDMPSLSDLNRSYYEQVRSLDGLINDMINRTYEPSISYEDGYDAKPISGLSDAEVNAHLEAVQDKIRPIMTESVKTISGSASLITKRPVEVTENPAEIVFRSLGKCRMLFNALTLSEVMTLEQGTPFDFNNPYRYNLPLCHLECNMGSKIPDHFSANKAESILLSILQGIMFEQFDSQSSSVVYTEPVDPNDIACKGLQAALARGKGKFIQRMLGAILLVTKSSGHFDRLLGGSVMSIWKDVSFSVGIKKVMLALQSYDQTLIRSHRKHVLLLSTLLDEIMAPDSQHISAGEYLQYIGEELTSKVFPNNKFVMTCKVEDIDYTVTFNLQSGETMINDTVATDDLLEYAISECDFYNAMVASPEGVEQNNCVLYCAYTLFVGLTNIVEGFMDTNLPDSIDRRGFGGDFESCVDIFSTMHYMSLNLKAKINSVLYKLLPPLNIAYQTYTSVDNNKVDSPHYHAIAQLLDQTMMIQELNTMFSNIDHLSKFMNNEDAFNSLNSALSNLGISSYLNNLHIGFMNDPDYKTFQTNLMCCVLVNILRTDASDWVSFARDYVKYEQSLRGVIEKVAALKHIQMAATNREHDPFPMYKEDLMREVSSEQVMIKLLTLSADSANTSTLTKFMADKAIDPDSDFVIWKTGTHFVYRSEQNHICFVHAKGLVFDRDPQVSRFEVYTLDQAINDWRLFS